MFSFLTTPTIPHGTRVEHDGLAFRVYYTHHHYNIQLDAGFDGGVVAMVPASGGAGRKDWPLGIKMAEEAIREAAKRERGK